MCLESLREAAQNGDANSQFTYGYDISKVWMSSRIKNTDYHG